MNRKLFWFFFVLIAILAVYFRFFKLGSIPVALYWDEVAILADARIVAETGRDMHGNHWFQAIYPSYGDYKLPGYIWLATLAVKLVGNTELAVRLPSALAGLSTMLVAFFLVKQANQSSQKHISSDFLQLSVLLIVATSFWSIMFSRTAFEGHLAQLLVGVSILLVFLSKKRPWLLLFSALVGALAVYTYYSVRFVWPVVFCIATVIVFLDYLELKGSLQNIFQKNKKNIQSTSIFLIVSLVGFFALLIPMSQSPYYAESQRFRLSANSILQQDPQVHEANYYRLLSGNSFIDRVIFHRDLLTLKLLAANYSKNMSLEFLFLTGDPNLRHGTGQHGLYALILIIPFFSGFFLLFRYNKKLLFLLLSWWIISLLPASVPIETPHALRSLNALLPMAVIIAYGMTYFFSVDSKVKKAVTGIFFCVLAFQIFAFWHHYLIHYPKESASNWQDGYKQLSEKIYIASKEYDVQVILPDERLYVWLLAYSYYSPSEIQSWEKPGFQLNEIRSIKFEHLTGSVLDTFSRPIVVVGETEELETITENTQARISKMEYVLDTFGEPRYVLNYFEPKNEK